MRLDPEPEKAPVLDLRAKLLAGRQSKAKARDDPSDVAREGRRITRALARSLHIEDDEDEEEWEGSFN